MNFAKIKQRLAANKVKDDKGRTKEWLEWYENQQLKVRPFFSLPTIINPL